MISPVSARHGTVLALGGGGAAGLAHIGVLQVLAENDVPVRAIAGTSIGAEIGAFIASGMSIQDLTTLATSFDWKQTLQLFMPDLPSGGLISGIRIMDFLKSWIGVQRIEDLSMGYVAMATNIANGEQVILDHGDLVDAVRASISVPGILAPHRYGDRLLVDGGLVNPLPFDVARDRFGGPVLAVGLHADLRRPLPVAEPSPQWPARVRQLLDQAWIKRAPGLRTWLETQLTSQTRRPADPAWSARRVLDRAMDITEAEIVRLRMAANPPDLLLTPRVEEIGLLEFYRAQEAIDAGRRAMLEQIPELRRLLDKAA